MSELPFCHLLRVRYAECDAQKVVFNSRYGEFVDVACCEFLRALGFGPNAPLGEVEFQLVRQLTQWQAPAHYDDVLEIRVFAIHLGTTSFTLRSEFRRPGSEALLTQVETTYVHVEPPQLRKAPLPPALRAALERGAPGVVSDHAGFGAKAS